MLIKSLRTEIALFSLTSIIVACGLVLWFSFNSYEMLYQRAASDDLNSLSENLAIELISSVDAKDDFLISNTLLQLDQYENVRLALVQDQHGNIVSTYLGNALTRNKTPEQLLDLSNFDFLQFSHYPLGMTKYKGNIISKKRIGDSQSSLGYLVIVNDLNSPLVASKKNLLWSVLPWVLLTIFVNVALIIILQSKALRPLVQLAKFTRKIRDTNDYSLVARVSGKQEIATLTHGLNSMMEAINSATEKNKQKNALLLEQQAQMEKLANFDSLTGLPNRQFFMQKLQLAINEAKAEHSDVILMFFDLDGFKLVNDSFGHEIGDRLLCIVAEKIRSVIGSAHEVARLGGDEFLVLIKGSPTENYIKQTAEQFISIISQAITISQWKVQVGTSIGIAKASVANYSLNSLVINADIAMYRAKADGRNRYVIFSQDMIESSRRKLNIANAISFGLSNNEFCMHYQAKVDTNGNVVGYEALARWYNSELGHISPVEFINIAEQSGKISDITLWVIERVCMDARDIINAVGETKIALNLSVHDLKNRHLFTSIASLLKKHRVNPRNIEFEITESAYLENFDTANRFISEIKKMGSTIALDDFGTGYSSLSYLTQINIDTLKIDKQFVDRIGISNRSTLVTKTIIELAKQLNLQVCAEGVETLEQSKILVEAGCHIMQGYYYAKPTPIKEVLKQIETVKCN